MLKAIYIGDVNYKEAPVFTFDQKSGFFVHETEEDIHEYKYSFYIVMNDPDWIVFATNGESVYPIENKNRVPEDQIYNLNNN
ncbi:hypothetical protein [Siminovitchia sp. 179-K 8D1 HS]|uniref:hypothetical protein n=1 Tax=Siminovitchia sp. 179-K 8D1 HS TaxID=3142385 RepID=UPI0039A1CA0F